MVIITSWTVGTLVTIGLIVQTTGLTRMMRRVRETINVKMNRTKQVTHDENKFKAMNAKFLVGDDDLGYVPNPARNKKEIVEVRTQVKVWKQEEESRKVAIQKSGKGQRGQTGTSMDNSRRIGQAETTRNPHVGSNPC